MDYAGARAACRSKGGSLAMPKDKPTNDLLVRLRNGISRSASVWIGLNDIQQEGRFVWEDGQILGSFHDWASSEPNNQPDGNADCVFIEKATSLVFAIKWRDYACNGRFGFICEKAPGPGRSGSQRGLAAVHRSNAMTVELSKCASILEKAAKSLMTGADHYSLDALSRVSSSHIVGVCHGTRVPACPTTASPEFRSTDGRCNNQGHPLWGSTEQCLKRLLPPQYDDGFMTPRTTGRNRTPPPQSPTGQPGDARGPAEIQPCQHAHGHAVRAVPGSRHHPHAQLPGGSHAYTLCVDCTCDSVDEHCFNIPVPSDDPDFSARRCLGFARSRSCPNEGCRMGRRQQLNQITAFVDASNVYGSSDEEMVALRDRGGAAGDQKRTTFPGPRSTSNYARLGTSLSRDLTSFTLCLHMRTDMSSSSDSSFVSYAVTQHNNELLVLNKGGSGFKLFVQGEDAVMGALPVWDGARHAICVTWRGSDGAWQVYADGVLKTTGSRLCVGGKVRSGGAFIHAQDQDTVGGGFAANQAFTGELSQVNLWDRVLSPAEIGADWAAFCNHHGNVIDWATETIQVSGQAVSDQYSCPVTSAPGSACPSGYQRYNGICYKAFNTRKNFLDASSTCVADGGTLAMPKGARTNAFLVNLKNAVDRSGLFWIGLVDQHQEGGWEWIDGRPLASYNAWGPGEPNNSGDEDCAEFLPDSHPSKKNTWNDAPCSRADRKFICQKIPAGCPDGYDYHLPTGRCYKAFNDRKTYNAAAATCAADGGTLAMPRGPASNKFLIYLKNAVDNNAVFRFGLTDRRQEGGWMWDDNVALGSFRAWGPGEPNNAGNEDCAEYSAGSHSSLSHKNSWNDGPCTSADRKFICQVKSSARGLLKSRPNPADANKKEFLPGPMTEDFECDESTGPETCSQAGDFRVNEQPGLTSMHTVFLREHNRIARRLSGLLPRWDDDRVFFETRKIVGALMQKITYGEDLPRVLGPDAMTKFHLTLAQSGFFSGYDPSVNPTISNVFATAAYRFGHSLVQGLFRRHDPDFNPGSTCPFELAFSFFNPSHIFNNDQGGPDSILRGLTAQPHQDFDRFMVSGLTKHLFADPPGSPGLDLAALNIQRGRDHGLPGYNAWRVKCGLRRAARFDDLAREIPDVTTRQKLTSLYSHVDDIDVFVGGLAEASVPGGVVGPTFACLIGLQFQDLRKGDRFWFENSGQFTEAQLAEIRRTSLARILCDNTDGTTRMQPDVFLQPTQPGNERVACSSLPQMDLTKWRQW
ncbi:uncharacterized protein [Branchiostoma lanceolatum]|uniref:uncharacterized protein n=1 Tax=Branchiostoma lanceolatum TaxID=7740 RepID=UPI0034557F3A